MKVRINRMSMNELIERMKSDQPYLLVDARPWDLYDRCHMPGAISMPEEDVEAYADKFDRNMDIIIYGSAIFCNESTMTALRFARMGFIHVYDYGGGLMEWLQYGNPSEASQWALP